MPVWSVIIGFVLLIALAVKLAILGGDRHLEAVPLRSFPRLAMAGTAVGLYVMALAVINLGSVAVQCGIGECHTIGYALLGYTAPAT